MADVLGADRCRACYSSGVPDVPSLSQVLELGGTADPHGRGVIASGWCGDPQSVAWYVSLDATTVVEASRRRWISWSPTTHCGSSQHRHDVEPGPLADATRPRRRAVHNTNVDKRRGVTLADAAGSPPRDRFDPPLSSDAMEATGGVRPRVRRRRSGGTRRGGSGSWGPTTVCVLTDGVGQFDHRVRNPTSVRSTRSRRWPSVIEIIPEGWLSGVVVALRSAHPYGARLPSWTGGAAHCTRSFRPGRTPAGDLAVRIAESLPATPPGRVAGT
jgi:hypothetical protein